MIKEMSAKEYATKRKITLQAVTKQLRACKKPKGVTSFRKIERFYLLNVRVNHKGEIAL